MHRPSMGRIGLCAAAVVVLLAAGCGKSNSSSGGGGSSLKITSPANGAAVSEPFVLKLDAGVPLGDPSTGDHHVHLCFDGASCDSGNYKIVYGNSFTVTGLAAGKHTIEASLRNADHSAAGATTSITVTITGGGASSASPSSGGGGGGGGYGY